MRRGRAGRGAQHAHSTPSFSSATSELARIERSGFSYSEISGNGTHSLAELRHILQVEGEDPPRRRRSKAKTARGSRSRKKNKVAVAPPVRSISQMESQVSLSQLLHRPSVIDGVIEEFRTPRDPNPEDSVDPNPFGSSTDIPFRESRTMAGLAAGRGGVSIATSQGSHEGDHLDAHLADIDRLQAIRDAYLDEVQAGTANPAALEVEAIRRVRRELQGMPVLRSLDDVTQKKIQRMPRPTYEEIELSRELLTGAEQRRPSRMYRALDAVALEPLDSPPTHPLPMGGKGKAEPHALAPVSKSRPVSAAQELVVRKRSRHPSRSARKYECAPPPQGERPLDEAHAAAAEAGPGLDAASVVGKMKLREQRKELALLFKQRLSTLQSVETDTRRTWATHGSSTARNASQLAVDLADSRLETTDIGEALDELIAQIRMWLPKELLFRYGLHTFLHQRGVQLLHSFVARLQQASRMRSFVKWHAATLKLRETAERNAGALLTRVARGMLGRVEARSRREARAEQIARLAVVREKHVSTRVRVATIMQRHVRSWLAARNQREEDRRDEAARVLQRSICNFKGKLFRLVLMAQAGERAMACAVAQRVYRGHLGRRRVRLLRRVRTVEENRELERLQRLVFLDEFKLHGAAVRIQARWHGRQARVYTRRLVQYRRLLATKTLQRSYRAYVLRREAYKKRKVNVKQQAAERQAAVVLQRMFKGHVTRRKFQALQRQAFRQRQRKVASKQRLIIGPQLVIPTGGAPLVLNLYRFRRTIKETKRLFSMSAERKEQAAALTLQRVFRGHRARQRYKSLVLAKRRREEAAALKQANLAAIQMQKVFKGFQAREIRRGVAEEVAASKIQRNWRGARDRYIVKQMESRENAALALQRMWRGSKVRRFLISKIRQRIVLGRHARRIQAAWRMRSCVVLLRELRDQRRRREEMSLAFHWSNEHRWANVKRDFILTSAYDEPYKLKHSMQRIFGLWSSNGERLESIKFSKMLRESPNLMGKLTTRSIDIVFAQCKSGKARFLDYLQFIQALDLIAEERFPQPQHQQYVGRFEGREARLLRLVELHMLEAEWAAPVREYLDHRAREHIRQAATLLQRIYRGRAARVFFRHTLLEHVRMTRDQRLAWAASKIQSLYRRRQGKHLMALRVKQVLRKYVDAKSGEPYWMNPRTGHVTWYKPKLLGDEDVDIALCPPDEYTAFRVTCAECGERPSTRLCEQCEDPYCSQCFHDLHRYGKKAGHTFLTIRQCPECEYQAATRVCDACTGERLCFAHYCDSCFDAFHADPLRKAKHAWSPLVQPCTQCGDRASRWRCNQCQDVYCSRCASDSHYRGHRQLHKFTYLAYYTPEAHRQHLAELRAKANAVSESQQKAERQQVAEGARVEAALKIQNYWRSYRGYMAGQARIRRARRTKHREWLQRRHDDRIRASWKFRVLDAMLLAPPLPSETYEEKILRAVRPWQRTRAHNSLARNHAPEPPTDPKKAPKEGFKVGTFEELVAQAKLLGSRLPGYVTVYEDETSVGTTANLKPFLKKGKRVRIRDKVFYLSKKRDSIIDEEQITLDRPWTDQSMEGQAIYLMPPLEFTETVKRNTGLFVRNTRLGQKYYAKKSDVAERIAGGFETWAAGMPGDWPLAFFFHGQKRKWLKRSKLALSKLKEPPQEVADALAKKERERLRAKAAAPRAKRGPSGPAYMRDKPKTGAAADSPWEKREDDGGNEFYYNTETEEVQWEVPEELKDAGLEAAKAEAAKRLEAMRARRGF